jgi:3-hydroxyacyl-[acyl-carrier-protein] dehydratase
MRGIDSKGLFSIPTVVRLTPGDYIEASGTIPDDLELFQDHFPDYPVLPGVLALEIFASVAQYYCRKVRGGDPQLRIKCVTSVKFSRFLEPGDVWASHLKLLKETDSRMLWKAELTQNGSRAVSAVLDITAYAGKQVV